MTQLLTSAGLVIGGLSAFVAGSLFYGLGQPGTGLAFIVAGCAICLTGVWGDD